MKADARARFNWGAIARRWTNHFEMRLGGATADPPPPPPLPPPPPPSAAPLRGNTAAPPGMVFLEVGVDDGDAPGSETGLKRGSSEGTGLGPEDGRKGRLRALIGEYRAARLRLEERVEAMERDARAGGACDPNGGGDVVGP